MARSTSGRAFPISAGPRRSSTRRRGRCKEGSNQYPPSRGLPQLREAVAAHYSRHHGLELDADHVCVTSGATEALGAAILATVSPGDEVIIFTPAYDSYAPMIRRAGGDRRAKSRCSRPSGGSIAARSRRRSAPKTRAIIFNNPHNPTGRLFDADELEAVAAVAREHDLIVISDEVWEHILLDGQRFTPLASLPGMAERTIKIGSAGKIFSLTGWKVGWLVAPPELASVAARAHQFLTFATAPNLQAAVAFGLDEGDAWIEPMRQRFARARDRMAEGLRDGGLCGARQRLDLFPVRRPRGVGHRARRRSASPTAAVEQAGVAVVPLSAVRRRGPAAAPGPAVLRQARRDDRRGRRGDGQGARSCCDEPRRRSRASCSTQLGVDGRRASWSAFRRSTGRRSARVAAGDPGAAPARAPQQAFLEWRTVPAPRRGELVRLLGEELRAAKEPLARLVTLEAGKIVQEGLGEVQEMIDICDFAVGLSRQLYGLTIASERPDHRMIEQWHPLGPVLVISAFNFPVAVWAWNAALALVCGDPVIWKPSEKTPLTAAAVMALAKRALERFGDAPDGLLQLVQGGREVGEALVDDPRIALVSATGSTAMGRAVGPRVAQRFGRVAARAWRQQCDDRRAERRPRLWPSGRSCSRRRAPPASAARRCAG